MYVLYNFTSMLLNTIHILLPAYICYRMNAAVLRPLTTRIGPRRVVSYMPASTVSLELRQRDIYSFLYQDCFGISGVKGLAEASLWEGLGPFKDGYHL